MQQNMKNQNGGHGSGDELPVGIIDKPHTVPGLPRRRTNAREN